MQFRLCLALGYSHPDEMLDSLSSRQYREWVAFYGIEPFGDVRADLRAGIIASTVNNKLRGKNERTKQPLDYMPFYERQQQTPEEIRSTIRAAIEQANGASRRNINRPSCTDGAAD